MRTTMRWLVSVLSVVMLTALAVPSWADHDTREMFGPITARGENAYSTSINSDLAFWGDRAYQGNFNGFRILDISDPDAPSEILQYETCVGDQGDVMVWDRTPGTPGADLLIRSWNSNTSTPTTATCDGDAVPSSFEGLHVFDLTNEADPDLLAQVDLQCGSHTATLVPDLANNRLLVYNSGSNGNCPWLDLVEIPLGDPSTAHFVRKEAAARQCHDTQVFLDTVLRTVCSGGDGFTVWSMDPADGGSLQNPMFMYTRPVTGVTIGHSAAFTWDGDTMVFGWEPGGGTQAECEESDGDWNRWVWFFETDTGTELGHWEMSRPQSSTENCTMHNYMLVPTHNGKDILVSGNYQAGTWVTDITDPKNPVELAYADPAPLDPNTLILGGAWSTYWYNGFLYESEITKGLRIFEFTHPNVAGAEVFDHLNPQTQEERLAQTYSVASSTTFGHSASRPHAFRGKVSADDSHCLAGRTVRVRKVREGPDRNVGSDTTGPLGGWQVPHDTGGAGRYYAVLAASTVTDVDTYNCGRATTGRLSVAR